MRLLTIVKPKHAVGAVLALAIYALLASVDALEYWVEVTQEYEDYELDELPLVFPFLFLWFAWVYRDLSREKAQLISARDQEIAERIETEAESRRLREQLETALEHRSLFFTAMSHDLRTPLNAVLGYSELLGMNAELDDRSVDHARRIGAGGRLLLMLVDEILDVAALDAGEQVRLHEDSFSLENELQEIAEFCCFVSNRAPLELCVDPVLADRLVTTDRRRLRQCLTNLVFNAFKHGGQEISLRIEATVGPDNGLTIRVADDGPGFPSTVMERIGQPFLSTTVPYRAESSAGFGLYMVRRYMELLGGRLSIGPSDEGGAEANLALPPSVLNGGAVAQSST